MRVVVSAFAYVDTVQVISGFQQRVQESLRRHTDLTVTRVVVRVHDADVIDEDGVRS